MATLFVSPFTDPYEQNSNRVTKLKKIVEKGGGTVTLITTNFDHSSKQYYHQSTSTQGIIHLNVPSYKNNLSFIRFWSHTIFALKLFVFLLNTKEKFDALYCTVPTSLTALVCILYARYKNIRCAVDVIDLWPNSFVVLLPFQLLFNILLFPWYLTSWIVYRLAPKLFAASKHYTHYIQKFNPHPVNYINLGIDLELINRNIQNSTMEINKEGTKIIVTYGGSLGKSYDFDLILNTLIALKHKGIENFDFLFIGDGEQKEYIQQTIDTYQLSAKITGKLEYMDYIKCLSSCDIGINAFKKNTKVVYSYKFNDYLGTGLAIINNLQGETSDIVSTYNLGLNFDYNETTLESVLEKLLTNPSLLQKMKINSLHYAHNIGNYEIEYQQISDYLMGKK